jgi:hypothetical protein
MIDRLFRFKFSFFIVFFCYSISLFGIPTPSLYKQAISITVDLKSYMLPGDEPITLYGAKRRKFLTEHWFWGEAGYGAITGKRSGYIEGGLIGGWMGSVWKSVILESRFFLGAAGGGSAPAAEGGGVIINPTVGIWAVVKPGILVGAEAGYLHYLNGTIESVTLGGGITFYMWELNSK